MRVRMAQRMLWLTVMILAAFGSLGYRLFTLQIQESERLTREAHAQRTQALPLQMRRGQILDRNGVPLTDPESSIGLAVFPKLMPEAAAVRRALTPVIGEAETARVLAAAALGPDPRWALIGLSSQTAEAVDALGLPGIATGPVGSRYGAGSLARHLVGYASDQGGQLGLELAFERDLAGDRVPVLQAQFDGRGRPLAGGQISRRIPETGKEPYDLVTTIDSRIQRQVEAVMDQTAHPAGGVFRGAVVVLDARTGEPLAIASRPDYTQTKVPTVAGALVNRGLSAYEPGSVFKPLVAAVALEGGVVSMGEEFTCTGHYELGDTLFGEPGKGHGRLTFTEAVAQSCNITFIKVGLERLGRERLLETAKLFGLGRPTGLYPGADEAAGRLPVLRYGGDVAQFSFGQGGLLTSPLQVARAYAAIANGGVLPPVRLVTAVKKPDGEVIERPPVEPARRVISPETAHQLQEALRLATDPKGKGTGRKAWVDGVGSAGKTGSAETGKEVHAWFAGWVPAEKPRYVITVMIENGEVGGLYAAPLFRRVAEAVLALD